MKKIAFCLVALVALTMMTGVRLQAQTKDMFPMDKGLQISYICYDADGKQIGSFTRVNKEAVGEMTNGHIIAEYNFYHADGSPFWKSDNVVKIEMGRRSGASYTIIDLMSKFMKIRHLLPTGDPSTVTTAYGIGDKLPDAEVAVKLGHMDIKILIRARSVKTIGFVTVKGGTFQAWNLKETVITKTPVGSSSVETDTWYAPGVGVLKQSIYENSKLKSSLELTNIQR